MSKVLKDEGGLNRAFVKYRQRRELKRQTALTRAGKCGLVLESIEAVLGKSTSRPDDFFKAGSPYGHASCSQGTMQAGRASKLCGKITPCNNYISALFAWEYCEMWSCEYVSR